MIKTTNLTELLNRWEQSTKELSGNLTTNNHLPIEIKNKLLYENKDLISDLHFEESSLKPLCPELNSIKGLNIISNLQKLKKKDHLTVYRTIRFPTIARIHETVHNQGLSIPNYEQERILQLYENREYLKKRAIQKKDQRFITQPQERVVDGLPVFNLVNDALQIHQAYRNEQDRVLLIGIHIPYKLIESESIELIANTAIDLDYNNDEQDFKITEFQKKETEVIIDYSTLRVQGIDLHEMYIKGLPFNLEEHSFLGLEQRFFLLDIYKTNIFDRRQNTIETEILKKNEYFMHGIFGDQNVFGRNTSKYLPINCYEVKKNEF